MPVHDDIYAIGNSRIHDGARALLAELRILQITLSLTLIVVDLDTDRCTHHLGIPVLDDMLHRIGIIETRPEHIPAEAHALQLDGITFFIHEGRALDMQTLHLRSLLRTCCQKQHHCH